MSYELQTPWRYPLLKAGETNNLLGMEESMIDLIVNTPEKEFVHEGLKVSTEYSLGEEVHNILHSAHNLYPNWTSMVVTVTRPEDTPN